MTTPEDAKRFLAFRAARKAAMTEADAKVGSGATLKVPPGTAPGAKPGTGARTKDRGRGRTARAGKDHAPTGAFAATAMETEDDGQVEVKAFSWPEVLDEARVLACMRLNQRDSSLEQALRYTSRYWLPEARQAWAQAHPANPPLVWEGFLRWVTLAWTEMGTTPEEQFPRPDLPGLGVPRPKLRNQSSTDCSRETSNRMIAAALAAEPRQSLESLAHALAPALQLAPSSIIGCLAYYTTPAEWNYLRSRHGAHLQAMKGSRLWERVLWPEMQLALADARVDSLDACYNAVSVAIGGAVHSVYNCYYRLATPEQQACVRARFAATIDKRHGCKPGR